MSDRAFDPSNTEPLYSRCGNYEVYSWSGKYGFVTTKWVGEGINPEFRDKNIELENR